MGDRVLIWQADGEVAGRGYAADMTDRLVSMGMSVEISDHTTGHPTAPEGFDLLILTGGRTPAGLPVGWMPGGLRRTREAVERARLGAGPAVLGICLGAQMIAESLAPGAVRNALEMELGFVNLIEPGARQGEPVAEFHYQEVDPDAVRELGGRILASTVSCAVQHFSLGPRVAGVQYHPEFSPEALSSLIDHSSRTIEAHHGVVSRARRSIGRLGPRWRGERFDGLVRASLAGIADGAALSSGAGVPE